MRAFLPDHRGDEARPVRPVEPGGADHVARQAGLLQHGPFPGQLGAAVRGARGRQAVLRIRLAAPPVEHVVRGDLDERGPPRRTAGGQPGHGLAVDPERGVLAGLSVVHRGPGRAVDDHRGLPAGQRLPDGTGVGDVEIAAGQPGHGLAPVFQHGHQIPAQHPPGPGHQPPAHRPGPALAGRFGLAAGPGHRPGARLPGRLRSRAVSAAPTRRGGPRTSAPWPPGRRRTGCAARSRAPAAPGRPASNAGHGPCGPATGVTMSQPAPQCSRMARVSSRLVSSASPLMWYTPAAVPCSSTSWMPRQ